MNKKVLAAVALGLSVLAGSASANLMYKQTRPTISGRAVAHAGSPAAALAGMKVLQAGGTAFDAALAMAAAQSYSEVMMCHIFGGDLQLIGYSAKDKKVFSFNGTGWAPNKAKEQLERDAEIPAKGIFSMHIPGEWSGWMTFLAKYGTMPLKDILAPVVDMAENGIIVDDFLANMIEKNAGPMNDQAKAVFFPNGKALKAGDVYVNKDYADLMKTMGEVAAKAAEGKTLADGFKAADDYFYRGPVAEEIVKWNNENGGDFSIEDFNEFHAEETTPITTNYRGIDVYCTPPNSQGTVLIETLNMLENYDLKAMGHNSKDYINVLTQALQIAINHRNRFSADPRFHKFPAALLTKEFAKEMTKQIDMNKAVDEIPLGDQKYFVDYEKKGPDTTHMFVCDAEGNIVAVTHSINHFFGSSMMVHGIMMNDRRIQYSPDMDLPNALAPHKRTVQTITPSIALKDGEPYMAFGTPNADRQEQTKVQGFLNVVEFGMRPQAAVETPRIATDAAGDTASLNKYPKQISYMVNYPTQVDPKVLDELKAMGYKMVPVTNTGSLGLGVRENGFWSVGADPTRNAYTFAW
ncbi:gamma-glutamyltransferase family protein [Pyramidobacter piscolens]|uniref:Gamma-glutamyltransferase n=1 Tax=Pyramidobacter piscolens W5455 TaxID=352165 RepID=A0ABM9ZU63_9BACT|nr:gamma-glutamyltransferase [Pyramidobacter piscolens]EFB90465.1 putative gamma-glutamyltransferase [Pyramidobacter piscolens W5455]